VTSVAFSKDDKYIISGSDDNSIKIWERETGSEIQILKGHSDKVTSIAVSKDDKYIISGSDDYSIKIWEL
jgi:WD40 repeat protein